MPPGWSSDGSRGSHSERRARGATRATAADADEGRYRGQDLGFALYGLGCIEALEGHPDRAFAALEEALGGGMQASTARNLPTDPALKSLHDDPRFEALAAKALAVGKGK
jgi:hypothetical protein